MRATARASAPFLLLSLACDPAPASAPEAPRFREGPTIEVVDGTAESLLAALESADSEGATVVVRGHYELQRGIRVARDVRIVGEPDETGGPPRIDLVGLDAQQPESCPAVACVTGGNRIDDVVLSVAFDPELRGDADTPFPVVHVDDSHDGKVDFHDVSMLGGHGVGLVALSERPFSNMEVTMKAAIVIVVQPLTLISIIGVSFVNFSDDSTQVGKIVDSTIEGVDVGVSVRTEGVSRGNIKTAVKGGSTHASASLYEAHVFDTEMTMVTLSGSDIDMPEPQYGAVLAPWAGGTVEENQIKVVFDAPPLTTEDAVAIEPPTDDTISGGNTIVVKFKEAVHDRPVRTSIPYVAGDSTRVVVGGLEPPDDETTGQ